MYGSGRHGAFGLSLLTCTLGFFQYILGIKIEQYKYYSSTKINNGKNKWQDSNVNITYLFTDDEFKMLDNLFFSISPNALNGIRNK